MRKIVVDTHAFLYWLLEPAKLPEKIINMLTTQSNFFIIPTMSILEIQYLIEIGRVEANIEDVLDYIRTNSQFKLQPFDEPSLLQSLKLSGNRDPFDRVILATALSSRLHIISRDRWITRNYDKCIWE